MGADERVQLTVYPQKEYYSRGRVCYKLLSHKNDHNCEFSADRPWQSQRLGLDLSGDIPGKSSP